MNGLPPPVLFGPFELLEPLGGGMSIVYRARRLQDDAPLAIKVLRRERLLDGQARARFAREIRAMQQLTHPAICPLLDAGEVDGMPYLCMPLLHGSTLAALLTAARTRGVPLATLLPGATTAAPVWRPVVALFAVLADALDFAHRRGFVHRDVKPANLWIDPDGNALLLDFGLTGAHGDRHHDLTRTGQIVGTPRYLAPEQLDGRLGAADARSDVYGLAAVLFEALAGEPPFRADSRLVLFPAILAGVPADLSPRLPGVPDAVADLLASALARDPADRHASAAALATDLRRVLAGSRAMRPRPGWPRRLLLRLRRPSARTTLAAVLLLGGALAGSLAWRFGRGAVLAAQREQEFALQTLPGRLALARAEFEALPPPWPEHHAVLGAWLRHHGLPLQLATDAEAAIAPGLREFTAMAVPAVQARCSLAATLQARCIEQPAAAWSSALRELEADARFRMLRPLPQMGLVPLGADPQSCLQEFYDVASGDPNLPTPVRDEHRQLVLQDHHGIVLVLVPGARHRLPAGGDEVELAPFLIAKHELTRAQHRWLDGQRDPTDVPLGLWNGELQTLRHPAECVPFPAALRLLRAVGLDLPSELQLQHARMALDPAATATIAANLRGDDDGFDRTAPVGSFPANAFGLHDTIGNVTEWCLDAYDASTAAPRAGDGLRGAWLDRTMRLHTGGAYGTPRPEPGSRWTNLPGHTLISIGVRPIRRWERR